MQDKSKTKQELIQELASLRQRIAEYEQTELQRKQTEVALRESEEKYRLLIENSHDIVYTVTQEGVFAFVSPSWTVFLGHPVTQVVGKHFHQFVHPEDVGRCETFLDEVIATGKRQSGVEYRVLHSDGRWRWHTSSAVPVKDKARMIVGYQGIARDITEQKRVEEALRESESTFRLLFEQAGYAAVIIENGRYIDLNDAALKMIGCSNKSALIDSTPADIAAARQPCGELSSEKAVRMMEIAVNQGSNRFEWVHKKLDGTQACREVVLTQIKMKGRKLLYTIWRDITEQKKAEEELKKSERRLADIIDFLPDATCVFDMKGKVITWNRAMEEMTGVCKNDMLGQGDHAHTIPFYGERRKCLLDLIDESDKDIEAKYQHVRREGSIIHGEAFAPTLNGGRGAHILMKGTPLYDTDGTRIGAIETIRDITKSKAIEDQLRQANKMEAIGTLAAGIAHDFNNILGGMIGYTEMSLLHSGTTNSQLKHYLEQIRTGIHRATDLVKQILTFSRQTNQKMRPIRVTPLLKETLKLIQLAIPSHIKIIYNIEVDRDLILADPILVHQILMNLCTNATHAMREKGGILRIEITNLYLERGNEIATDLKAGWHLRLAVSDSGPGIDAAIIDRIFDPFFTTKKPGEGTGLGLAVIHGIVNKLGGAIIAMNCPGEGALFEIYLPLIEVNDDAIDIDNDMEKVYVGGKGRILFVDDEDTITMAAEEMLNKMGYDILVTTSSVVALESFRIQPDRFDVVITDQAMPEMTGMAMAEEMLKIRPNLPIILCAGLREIVTPDQAEAIGIRGLIMKPFTMANLDATIRKVLLTKT